VRSVIVIARSFWYASARISLNDCTRRTMRRGSAFNSTDSTSRCTAARSPAGADHVEQRFASAQHDRRECRVIERRVIDEVALRALDDADDGDGLALALS